VYENNIDRRARFKDAVGVDMTAGTAVDVVADIEEDVTGLGLFAHIDCHSVLEHARRPWLLAANLQRMLMPGGTIYVQVPFVWRVHSYPSDLWRFTAEGIRQLFPAINWTRISYAHIDLSDKSKVPAQEIDGHLYFAKTEICAFGVKN